MLKENREKLTKKKVEEGEIYQVVGFRSPITFILVFMI
jgi:hypothetical protein